ncbi:MAG: serine hydrolase domain-containing protein [Bacteroidota bacterium]
MKILLYILAGLLLLVAGFFAWFFIFFLKVPSLNLSAELDETEKITKIDQWFEQLQEDNIFNGVVAFSNDGKTLLAKAYGYTNHKKDQSLTAHSSLRLASVSKQFTAAGIMLLRENEKLDYDDPVTQYVEGFPYPNVTIRHLLNQTSGVPDIYMDLAEKNKENISLLTNEIAVDLVVKESRKAVFSPNEQFQYSNTNYILLARIIELISGASFEDYMRTELFEPLGMKNTRVWNLKSQESTFINKANDFENFKGITSPIEPTFIDGVAGDGAVFSSATDMLIWDQFWYENDLISPDNLREAFVKPQLTNGKASDYGFGWMVTDNGSWHNGAWLGANTIIVRNTEKKTCMVILDNSSNIFFDKILKELR